MEFVCICICMYLGRGASKGHYQGSTSNVLRILSGLSQHANFFKVISEPSQITCLPATTDHHGQQLMRGC